MLIPPPYPNGIFYSLFLIPSLWVIFLHNAFVHQDTYFHQDASVNPILAGGQVLTAQPRSQTNRNKSAEWEFRKQIIPQ